MEPNIKNMNEQDILGSSLGPADFIRGHEEAAMKNTDFDMEKLKSSNALLSGELKKIKNDYKNLIISYNELSSAFRAHLNSVTVSGYNDTIKTLLAEKEYSLKEKNFFIQQIYSLLIENQRLVTGGNVTLSSFLNFTSIQELVFQNLFLKDFFQKESDEKLVEISKKLIKTEEIVKSQDLLINELKAEISSFKQNSSQVANPYSQTRQKTEMAVIEELEKKVNYLEKENEELEDNEKKYLDEIVKLRASLGDLTNKIELQKNTLMKENSHLAETNKELEKMALDLVAKSNESIVRKKISELREENSEFKEKYRRAYNENAELKVKISQNQEFISSLSKESEEKDTKITRMSTSLNNITNALEKTKEKLAVAEEKLKETEENLKKTEEEAQESDEKLQNVTEKLRICIEKGKSLKKTMQIKLKQFEEISEKKSIKPELSIATTPLFSIRSSPSINSEALKKLIILLYKTKKPSEYIF